jgi:hypothetical protein
VNLLFTELLWLQLSKAAGANLSGYAIITGVYGLRSTATGNINDITTHSSTEHYANTKFDSTDSTDWSGFQIAKVYGNGSVGMGNYLRLDAVMQSNPPVTTALLNMEIHLNDRAAELWGGGGYGRLEITGSLDLLVDGYQINPSGEEIMLVHQSAISSVNVMGLRTSYVVPSNFQILEWCLKSLKLHIDSRSFWQLNRVYFTDVGGLIGSWLDEGIMSYYMDVTLHSTDPFSPLRTRQTDMTPLVVEESFTLSY